MLGRYRTDSVAYSHVYYCGVLEFTCYLLLFVSMQKLTDQAPFLVAMSVMFFFCGGFLPLIFFLKVSDGDLEDHTVEVTSLCYCPVLLPCHCLRSDHENLISLETMETPF